MSGDSVTLLVSGGIGIVQFIAVIPAILYIDKWGRKPLLRCGAAVTFLSHLTIAILVLSFFPNMPVLTGLDRCLSFPPIGVNIPSQRGLQFRELPAMLYAFFLIDAF